jgi:hypothetical protein
MLIQLEGQKLVELYMSNCRIELSALAIIDKLSGQNIFKEEKVYANIRSVVINLHQNILTFLHLLCDRQKETSEQLQTKITSLNLNSQTCILNLKQLCNSKGTDEFKNIEKLVDSIETCNSKKSVSLLVFDQDLQKIFRTSSKQMIQTPCSNLHLPSKSCSRPYTLVLDLDETLIHFDPATKQFKSRPYCLSFLKTLSAYFEIVVFTAATQNYAD